MSGAMSIILIVVTIVTLIWSLWLILWSGRQGPALSEETTGHEWDGLKEGNNPLPRWWLGLFVITLVWGFGYLLWYPGMGSLQGFGGWSQHGAYDEEVAAAEAQYGPLFAQYAELPTEELLQNNDALNIGRSLFANYCSQCHGSTGYGAPSFPNLADDDWLYGDSLESIQMTILNGRLGIMPALGAVLSAEGELDDMVDYVRNMSAGQDTTTAIHTKYVALCSACHGADGSGNQMLGGPALNDDIWLHGSGPDVVRDIIVNGRQNRMPAHRQLVGEDRARLMAAYVRSLSAARQRSGD